MRSPLGVITLASLALCAGARLTVAAPPAQGGDASPCVDVQIGNDRALDLDCINRQLRFQASRQKMAPAPVAPIGAGSSSTAIGTANQAAAQQMMGDALGKSSEAQRPAPQVFLPALPHVGTH